MIVKETAVCDVLTGVIERLTSQLLLRAAFHVVEIESGKSNRQGREGDRKMSEKARLSRTKVNKNKRKLPRPIFYRRG
jgi:hypothetical protein